MRIYIIYDMQTDEVIGKIEATNIIDAEIKACKKYNKGANEIYALTE